MDGRNAKDRRHTFGGLIDRAFNKHRIPHDGLGYWKRNEGAPLRSILKEVAEALNGVYAHTLKQGLYTRRTARNVACLVEATGAHLEVKNARSSMKNLYAGGRISARAYNAWKRGGRGDHRIAALPWRPHSNAPRHAVTC